MLDTVWVILIVVAVVALVGALIGCAWLLADRRALIAKQHELQTEALSREEQLESYRREIDQLKGDIAQARQQLAVAEQAQEHVQEQFNQAQKQLRDAFDSLASDALAKQSKQFLELASERLKVDQAQGAKQLDAAKQQFQSLVKPIGETLGKYESSMKMVEQSRREAYGSLTKQVELMVADQRRLRQETANLVRALRKPNVRGQWGQVQLRRVVELAGMIPHCDFDEQASKVTDDDRVLRPDMVVNLPNGRSIVVDAKTPLDAYLEALESQEDHDRQHQLRRHAQQVAGKIKELAAKQYYAQFDRSPDFVVLFIPGESFLYAALEVQPDLTESAMAQNVVIATPNTLISLLKAVALGWREERIAEHAQKISELGRVLHERIRIAVGHVQDLGRSLEQAVKRYNRFVGSFEGRVVASARKFEELGAGSAEALPETLTDVQGRVRQVNALPAATTDRSPDAPDAPVQPPPHESLY